MAYARKGGERVKSEESRVCGVDGKKTAISKIM